VRSGRRRVFTPDVVDEPRDGNDLVSAKKERGEHGKLLAAPELKERVADLGFDRAEDAESDRPFLARLT